jgi:acyl carrier protein
MTQDEIYAGVNRILRDLFGDEDIDAGPETTAEDIPGWDSFNHVNLIVAVESRFGIKFRTAELESLRNVGEMIGLIEGKLAALGR